MTIQDVIDLVDSIEPNAYNNVQKARWVNEIEGRVYTRLFLVQPYEYKTVTQQLALPAPYDQMYPRYLQAMIHYANGEYDRYANSMALFNEIWNEANRWFGGDFDATDRLRNQSFQTRYEFATPDTVEIPEGCAIVGGRVVVKTAYNNEATVTFSFDGAEIAQVNVAQVGATPLPMLQGGTGGSVLTVTAMYVPSPPFPAGGEMYITGRLLIPDEKWHYDPKYARRRDARWHG